MAKRRTKRKKIVSGNLLLAFFPDKIRLGIAVYSEKFFMLKRNILAIVFIVTFVFLIPRQ